MDWSIMIEMAHRTVLVGFGETTPYRVMGFGTGLLTMPTKAKPFNFTF